MSQKDPPPSSEKRTYVIFVGDVQEKWETPSVLARDIMAQAGISPPDNLTLEALDKHNGNMVKEFTPDQTVNLDEKDRKFFRIAPGGGGYSFHGFE